MTPIKLRKLSIFLNKLVLSPINDLQKIKLDSQNINQAFTLNDCKSFTITQTRMRHERKKKMIMVK